MIRRFGLVRGCAVAIGAAALFGCTGNNLPEGQPSFYQDLAGPAAALADVVPAVAIDGHSTRRGGVRGQTRRPAQWPRRDGPNMPCPNQRASRR